MMTRRWYGLLLALLGVALLHHAFSQQLGSLAFAAAARTVEVVLKDNFFDPPVITVHPGYTIVYRNQGRQLHAVTLIDHEDVLDQGFTEPQKSLTFVVPKAMPPGEYTLGCNIHMTMRGKLIVQPLP